MVKVHKSHKVDPTKLVYVCTVTTIYRTLVGASTGLAPRPLHVSRSTTPRPHLQGDPYGTAGAPATCWEEISCCVCRLLCRVFRFTSVVVSSMCILLCNIKKYLIKVIVCILQLVICNCYSFVRLDVLLCSAEPYPRLFRMFVSCYCSIVKNKKFTCIVSRDRIVLQYPS